MGTRGLRGFRYRGVYYMRYNHWDSYPRGLGCDIANEIPTDPEKFKEWIEKKKEFHEEERIRLAETGDNAEDSQFNDEGYHYFPCTEPPKNDLFIEWTYVVDLDRLLFIVDAGAHFPLDKVAHQDSWIKHIALDGSKSRCLRIDCPPDMVGDLTYGVPAPTPSSDGVVKGSITLVEDPDMWHPDELTCSCAVAAELAKAIVTGQYSQYSRIDELSNSENASERLAFHDLAKVLLHATAPGALHTGEYADDNEFYYFPETKNSRSALRHLNLLPHSFWFRNCLVIITTRLDVRENFEAEIGLMVSRMRDMGLNACTGLVWSVKHLIVVTCDAGKIKYSAAIPVVDPRSSLWPKCMLSGLRLLSHYLSPSLAGVNGPNVPTGQAPEITAALDTRTTFPLDIVSNLSPYTDSETHRNIQAVSKSCRQLLFMQPRIGQYTILRPLESTSYIPGNGDVSHFLAVDQAGEQHTIRFVLWTPDFNVVVPPLDGLLLLIAPDILTEWKRSFELFRRVWKSAPILFVGQVEDNETCKILEGSEHDASMTRCGY